MTKIFILVVHTKLMFNLVYNGLKRLICTNTYFLIDVEISIDILQHLFHLLWENLYYYNCYLMLYSVFGWERQNEEAKKNEQENNWNFCSDAVDRNGISCSGNDDY